MDNMAAGFARPQEDEFALAAMGVPTPYLKMAFPNHPAPHREFLDMQDVDDQDQSTFDHKIIWFFKALTSRYQNRLVLKSPPHTGRVATLNRLFPGAKFIHLARDPLELYASTMRLWRTLDRNQGFQIPRYSEDDLKEYVLSSLSRMYQGYEAQKRELADDQLIEIKYEDLIKCPTKTISEIYERFDLPDVDLILESAESFLQSQKSYQAATYDIDEPTRLEIQSRWHDYFRHYGYDTETSCDTEQAGVARPTEN